MLRSLLLTGAAVAAALSLFTTRADADDPQSARPCLIGGYGPGLYSASFDADKGTISDPKLLVELTKASFFAQHPSLDVWYCVSEAYGEGELDGPALVALRSDAELTKLEVINRQSAGGQGPCYVSTDAAGQYAFVANYGDGTVSMFPLGEDGSLQPASHTVRHTGSSVNPKRQKEPHAHCAVVDPSDQWLLCCDLGIDRVMIYRIDRDANRLVESSQPLMTPPGTGPRHLAFHPSLPKFYVIHELASSIAVANWDAQSGRGEIVQLVSTVPDDAPQDNSTAEILVHPSGELVFGSNRGHDSIASYRVDSQKGTLQLVGWCSTGGSTPRNFRVDPSGNYVLAANQNSDSVVVLRIDRESGKLEQTDEQTSVPKPACIKFARQP